MTTVGGPNPNPYSALNSLAKKVTEGAVEGGGTVFPPRPPVTNPGLPPGFHWDGNDNVNLVFPIPYTNIKVDIDVDSFFKGDKT